MSKRVLTSWFLRFSVLLTLVAIVIGCESKGSIAILDVDPKIGHTQGNQPVRILGKYFRQDIGYTIYFGARQVGSVTILNPETILVTPPTRSPVGPVDITIRTDDGNAFRIPDGFRFEDMAGSVVEGFGESGTVKKEEKGNLPY